MFISELYNNISIFFEFFFFHKSLPQFILTKEFSEFKYKEYSSRSLVGSTSHK